MLDFHHSTTRVITDKILRVSNDKIWNGTKPILFLRVKPISGASWGSFWCLEWIHLYAERGGGAVSCKLNYHVVGQDWSAVFKDHSHKRESYGLTTSSSKGARSGYQNIGIADTSDFD